VDHLFGGKGVFEPFIMLLNGNVEKKGGGVSLPFTKEWGLNGKSERQLGVGPEDFLFGF